MGLLLCLQLKNTYTVSLFVAVLVFLHAISRPVAIELSRRKAQKIVASDGFIDDAEGEETMVFSKDTSMPVSSPPPVPGCVRRKKSNLLVPMAKEEEEK